MCVDIKQDSPDEIFPDEISIGAILLPANTGYLLDADANQAREETYTCEGRGDRRRQERGPGRGGRDDEMG